MAILYLNSQPDLKVWHTARLDAEFTAASPVKSFADYLALENRLFAQLDEKVYDRIAPEDKRSINRYYRGSLSDPRPLVSQLESQLRVGDRSLPPANRRPACF